MMAVLWDDIGADVSSSRHHVEQAILLFEGERDRAASYVPAMAFQHAMQAGYTSFEAGMRRLLHLVEEPLPDGPDSQAMLLRRLGRAVAGGRPALLDAPLQGALDRLRGFRHVAMHSYDAFEWARAADAVEAARAYLAAIEPALARFRAAVDP